MSTFTESISIFGPYDKTITKAKYSPDGKLLGVLTSDQYIGILDSSNFSLNHIFDCSAANIDENVLDIAFSRDSCILVVTSNLYSIPKKSILSFSTFKRVSSLKHCNEINFLVAAAGSDRILVWNCHFGRIINNINTLVNEKQDRFTYLCFGPETSLAVATQEGFVYVYMNCLEFFDKGGGLFLRFDTLHAGKISSINFVSFSYLITGSQQSQCIKWDITNGPNKIKQQSFPIRFKAVISHVDVSPDERYVLLTYGDSPYDNRLASFKIIHTLKNPRIDFYKTYSGHNPGYKNNNFSKKASFWFTAEQKMVICGSQNHKIYMWDFETAFIRKIVSCHEGTPIHVFPVPRLKQFVSLFENGKLTLWKQISFV